MNDSEVIFNLLYALLSYCIIFPPWKFVEIGLTIDKLFKNCLSRNEKIEIIRYHQRRCCLTLIVHCFVPFTYTILYFAIFGNVGIYEGDNVFKYMVWNSFLITSLVLPLFGLSVAFIWYVNDWSNHPITRTLKQYCNNDENWHSVAASINDEFRR